MDKVKMDFANIGDIHKDRIVDVNGTQVTVRTHIPMEEKRKMAEEWTEMTVLFDDENNICLNSHENEFIRMYLMMKYYTNLDVDDVGVDDVANLLINTESEGKIYGCVVDDLCYVQDMTIQMRSNVREMYNTGNSLAHAVKTSFGFLFNGEDITETLAKSQILSDKMLEAVKVLQDKEKEAPKKANNGVLTVGGKIVNIAKKNK